LESLETLELMVELILRPTFGSGWQEEIEGHFLLKKSKFARKSKQSLTFDLGKQGEVVSS
jgi:hypothetical protein